MKAELSPGTLIHNQYRIQRVLGQGGLGRTYLSLDTFSFDERRVIKEFAPYGISSQSLQKAKDLFYREAQLLYQIKHPQIPRFFSYFEEDERLLLVQEYIEGKTYAELLTSRLAQQQVFSEAEVLRLMENLLPVLSDVHAQDIIHRDISIDNIMLSNQIPFLIDFGVGTQTSVGSSSFVGKFGYAPHEQLQLGQCSPSSDLYALAVTAIVLLTGLQPHQLPEQLISPEFWRSRATVSDEFAQIVQKMLAFYPSDRYRSATEVLSALKNIQNPLTATDLARSTPVQDESNLVTAFPSLPGGAMASRPLHFIWICDCSNSMSVDGKIQALNTAIEEVIPHMRVAAADNPNAKVLMRAVKFSTGATWCVAEETSIETFRWTDLAAEGITDLGAALHLVAAELSRMSSRALPPVLVLISDGQPTDDYISGLKALLDQPWGRKAIRVAISIGRDADQDVLQQFIGHPDLRPLRANNPEALIRQIRWASTAVLKAASAPTSAATSVLPMMTSVPNPGFDDVW